MGEERKFLSRKVYCFRKEGSTLERGRQRNRNSDKESKALVDKMELANRSIYFKLCV